MINLKNKQQSLKLQTILMNTCYTIASLIACILFVAFFFLHKINEQLITQCHLDIIICVLFMSGFIFTLIASSLEDAVKKEKDKAEIIKIFTENKSITNAICYANKHNIPLSLVYKTLIDCDSSLFQQTLR